MSSPNFRSSSPRGSSRGGLPPFGVVLGVIAAVLVVFVVIRLAWGDGPSEALPPPDIEESPTATDGTGGGTNPEPVSGQSGQQGGTPVPQVDEDGLSPQLDKIQRWGLPVYCGGGNEDLVALTFDDGPGPFTEKTLEYLEQQQVPATFFLVGKLFTTTVNEKLARLEMKQGEVANHSFSHFGLAGESTDTLIAEIDRSQRTLEEVTDTTLLYFRPPWGSRDAASDRHVAELGMITVIWSLDSTDSVTGSNADDIVQAIDEGLSAGDIVLMHENRGTTQAALPEILSIMRERGLTPVTLSELLTRDPPTRQQVKTAECS